MVGKLIWFANGIKHMNAFNPTVRRVGVSAGPCTWDPQAESQEGLEA